MKVIKESTIEGTRGHSVTGGGCIMGRRPADQSMRDWLAECLVGAGLLSIPLSAHLGRHASHYMAYQFAIMQNRAIIWVTIEADPGGQPSHIGNRWLVVYSKDDAGYALNVISLERHDVSFEVERRVCHPDSDLPQSMQEIKQELISTWWLDSIQILEEQALARAEIERQGLDEAPAAGGRIALDAHAHPTS